MDQLSQFRSGMCGNTATKMFNRHHNTKYSATANLAAPRRFLLASTKQRVPVRAGLANSLVLRDRQMHVDDPPLRRLTSTPSRRQRHRLGRPHGKRAPLRLDVSPAYLRATKSSHASTQRQPSRCGHQSIGSSAKKACNLTYIPVDGLLYRTVF